MIDYSRLFDTKRRLYIVKNKEFETDYNKKEKVEIDTWRPFFYDSFNRVGNCTILSLCENADALIKVIKGESFSLHNASTSVSSFLNNSHHHLRPYTSLRIYWKIANNTHIPDEELIQGSNICRDRSKSFYLCCNDQVSIVEKKDINLLRKNTSDTITQRLWGNHKMLSKLRLKEICRDDDEEMMPDLRALNGDKFWDLLTCFIKTSRPSFNFANIDFKLKTFTCEEKFPVNFWNTAQAETKNKLLSSVDSHWLLAQNYDKMDKSNFCSDLFLENVIKINHGKEKISSLFSKSQKVVQPRTKSSHHANLVTAAEGQEDLYGTVTDQRNLPMSMRYRKYTDHPSKVWVGPSKIHCQGLFAIEPYSQGDIVIEYVGEIIGNEEADRREIYYEKSGMSDCYLFRLSSDEIIDATYKGNAARFLNHSCDANCKAKIEVISGQKHILIFANRDISKGEELTYFYNFAVEAEKIECLCGAPNCLKRLN